MLPSLLDQVATTPLESYHPAHISSAVNALQPLGKEPALAQIESYLENRGKKTPATGLFWVLRVLFEMPAGQAYPPVRIGQPVIPAPANPAALPRFPIVLIQDIPFLAVTAYILGGKAEPVENHIRYFREHGALREMPLALPASLNSIEQEFQQVWQAAYHGAHAAQALKTIQAQLARLSQPQG